MTLHLHREFLENCYRCDLSQDERVPKEVTVRELAGLLAMLPDSMQDYQVWAESDPAGPISEPANWWINHERKTITL